jgi:hypothetical protein
MEAINEVNGPEAMSSAALMAVILMSIVLKATARKVLVAIFILIVPAIEGQVDDLILGFGLIVVMLKFEGSSYFDPPVYDFGFRAPEDQKLNKLFWVNAIVAVCWDLALCGAMIIYANYRVQLTYCRVWHLAVFLVIYFSAYVVVIGWICKVRHGD